MYPQHSAKDRDSIDIHMVSLGIVLAKDATPTWRTENSMLSSLPVYNIQSQSRRLLEVNCSINKPVRQLFHFLHEGNISPKLSVLWSHRVWKVRHLILGLAADLMQGYIPMYKPNHNVIEKELACQTKSLTPICPPYCTLQALPPITTPIRVYPVVYDRLERMIEHKLCCSWLDMSAETWM